MNHNEHAGKHWLSQTVGDEVVSEAIKDINWCHALKTKDS